MKEYQHIHTVLKDKYIYITHMALLVNLIFYALGKSHKVLALISLENSAATLYRRDPATGISLL